MTALMIGMCVPVLAQSKLKVGFIFAGPVSDLGWNASQNETRKALEKNLPWIETSYVESVPDSDIESCIDQMADQGVQVIFATGGGFMDGTLAAAPRHPDILFFNADGHKQAPNVGTYVADPYQCFYLLGMASGGLTKNGKIGCVSTYPEPGVVRIMDSYALGVRAVNPSAHVEVQWLNSWYDPPAAKEAAETLLGQGDDVLMNLMDCPTVAQVAEAHGVPVNGNGPDGLKIAPNNMIAASFFDWVPGYTLLLQKIHDGVITAHNLQNFDEWWLLNSHAVTLSYQPGIPLNPKFKTALSAIQVDDGTGKKIPVYDLILKRLVQMSATPPEFEPFTGPISDAQGKLRIPAGQVGTRAQLYSMRWNVPELTGSWPAP